METGLRLPNWELSTIDTCWLQMGMAFAQGWFDQEDEKEKERSPAVGHPEEDVVAYLSTHIFLDSQGAMVRM
jgi:hypothetical protein